MPYDNTNGAVEMTEEVIKRIYRSWKFSASKITVAKLTSLALFDCGLLSSEPLDDIDLDRLTADKIVKRYVPRAYRESDDD